MSLEHRGEEDNSVGGKFLKTWQRNLPLRYILGTKWNFPGRENFCFSFKTYFLLHVSSPSQKNKN